MNKTYSNATPKIVGVLVIAAVVASGAYAFVFKDNKEEGQSTSVVSTSNTSEGASSATPSSTSTTGSGSTSSASSAYKDGSYSSTANYRTPGGTNNIKVSIVLTGDLITSVETKDQYQDGESQPYISDFKSAISGKVVGKKINSLNLSRVGGASLTTKGFNAALADIMRQAKV